MRTSADRWDNALERTIRRSQAIVLVMTAAARQSDHVAYEWAVALGTGVTVIPLEFEETPLPARLDALHRLDFRHGLRPWDTLLAEVTKAETVHPRTQIEPAAGAPSIVKKAARAIDSPDR